MNRSAVLPIVLCSLLFGPGCRRESRPAPPAEEKPLRALDPAIESTTVEALMALGYVEAAEDAPPGAKLGVLKHDADLAFQGFTYMTSTAGACSSQLVDMDGKVVRSWKHEPCMEWDNSVLLPTGEVLAVHKYPVKRRTSDEMAGARRLIKFSWDGGIVWERQIAAHHDVGLTPSNRIAVLTRHVHLIPKIHPDVPVRDHFITILDQKGKVVESASITQIMLRSPDVYTIKKRPPRMKQGQMQVELVHANAVEWMDDDDLAKKHPIYAKTNVLICMRAQDSVAIIDWKKKKIVWTWGRNVLSGPHDSTVLENGNILIFDNGLKHKRSRVVELDPVAKKIVWEYKGPDDNPFFTGSMGASQRLENGNTLITVSGSARVFEVTPGGRIAWEYLNPILNDAGKPVAVSRARRFAGSPGA
ncbi:MAG: arylsulfotransferase family protein, partial [Pseudomonadota bacterium]